jgi:hypothetical protein
LFIRAVDRLPGLPGGIEPLDQFDLPSAAPLLHRALSAEGRLTGLIGLVVDEHVDAIAAGETWILEGLMFPGPAAKAVGLADVKRAISLAG